MATRLAEIRALLDDGDPEAAANAAADFARTDGAAHAGAHMLGLAALRLGDLASAIRALEAADAVQPDSRETQQALAIAYGRAGRIADAAFRIKQIGLCQPDPLLGNLLLRTDDGDLSEAFLGAGANPQKGEGFAALATGGFARAALLLEAAEQVDPDDLTIARLRAEALLGLGRLSEAEDAARRARRAHADRADAELTWASVLHAAGSTPEAMAAIAAALDHDPDRDDAAALAAAASERLLGIPSWLAQRIGAPPGAPRPTPRGRPVRRVGVVAASYADHPQAALLAAAAEIVARRGWEMRVYHAGGEAESRAAFALLRVAADASALRDLTEIDHASTARIWSNDALDVLIDATPPGGQRRTRALIERRVPLQIALNPSIEAFDLGAFDHVLADAAAPRGAFARRAPTDVAGLAPALPEINLEPLAEPDRDHPVLGLAAAAADVDAVLLDALARALADVPGARLLLLDPSFGELVVQRRVLSAFERYAVEEQVGVLRPDGPEAEQDERLRAALGATDVLLIAGPAPDLRSAAAALAGGLPVVAWTPGPSAASAAAGLAAAGDRAALRTDPIAFADELRARLRGETWRDRRPVAGLAAAADATAFAAWLERLLDDVT